ncbi:sensor histidine kinase [Humibacter albus]|uniref:sensor histidine kinase n=1 Tax=Humibacter albus TaxID=427754 RepID=UPI0003B777B6|nr:HAMP domain-containing sensor histidine kinase [Humibacter albus]
MTDAGGLRGAALRLAAGFAALILALFLLLAGVVTGIVAEASHQALLQKLVGAEHIDSPKDAPLGTYVAIVTPGGTLASENAPSGFPAQKDLSTVAASGQVIQATRSFGGQAYIVRTDADSGRVVQVAVSQEESQDELYRVVLALALAGIPTVVGAALIGWWMSLRAMRPLAEALALQRRFVADAGHELRTPLTLLSTRAQMLHRTLPATQQAPQQPALEEVSEGLEEIVSDTKTLTGILEDLLLAADPRQDAERTNVDLTAAARDAAATLRPEADARGVSIRVEGDGPVPVHGVRVSLSRAILALISNALDHARTTVTITTRTESGWAVLDVCDDGPGFPPGTTQRAFERFASSRAESADETGRRHYGLGLALVAEVAHRHGGTVSIATTGPTGAVLRLRLAAATR